MKWTSFKSKFINKLTLVKVVILVSSFSVSFCFAAQAASNNTSHETAIEKLYHEVTEKIEHFFETKKSTKAVNNANSTNPAQPNNSMVDNDNATPPKQNKAAAAKQILSTISEQVNNLAETADTTSANAAKPQATDKAQNNTPASAVVPSANTPIEAYSARQAQPITNKNISLNFSDISTRELIQVFAQFTGLNFVISDNVKGNMSVHLKNMPWPQALKVILQSQGLGQRRIDNTIIIAPIKEIANQEAQELESEQRIQQLKFEHEIQDLQAEERIQDLQPLVNRVVPLKYAKAEDIKDLLTKSGSLLSKRGKIGIDITSNSVWIRDTATYTAQLVNLIHKLDTPAPQVLIEARIVSVQRPYERSLGLSWGVTNPSNNLSGTLRGANFEVNGLPSTVDPVLADRLNFNQPAALLGSPSLTPATVGLALAQLGNSQIDLELSALEQEGKVELISSPRLVTSNLQKATIETGQEIPYQEASSSGATTISFKDAALKLEVTPRITSDNRVILTLLVTNNQAGDTVAVGTGTAVSIRTEQEESQVLLNNNQTIVLGGVYKIDNRKIVTRIPFLGQIPVVGYLFKQTNIRNTRDELLIFLTPKILRKPSDLNKE